MLIVLFVHAYRIMQQFRYYPEYEINIVQKTIQYIKQK